MPPPHPHPHPLPLHGHTHMELMGAISMDGMKEYAYFLIRIMGLVIRSLSSRDAMRKQFTVFFFQPWKQETMGTKSTHQSHPTTSPKVPRPTPECHITSGLTELHWPIQCHLAVPPDKAHPNNCQRKRL